ncbi:MAG: anthranilate synthase component I family protein [Bryobacteraceae bacterium]
MWSDRCSSEELEKLVAALREATPLRPEAEGPFMRALESAASPVEVAAALESRPGFVWLDSPGSHKIFHTPLLTLTSQANAFDLIEAACKAWEGIPGAILCGYLGYELGSEAEGLRSVPGPLPDLHLALYDQYMVWDSEGWLLAGTDAWRDISVPDSFPEAATGAPFPPVPEPTATPTDEAFLRAVERTIRRIHEGEIYQVNLCRKLETTLPPECVWPLYLRLRDISPADHGAFLRIDKDTAILSTSPELFLRVEDGEVRSYPIKGTRPRGATEEGDEALRLDLTNSEKDRAELAMIVDVTRNDLGRVCQPGSVRVGSHAELITLPTLHHTVSKVVGQLRTDATLADLLRATCPPASISGAPKIHAMEVAAEEEGFRRGPCMGSIGWLSLDGRMELSVAIRTAVAAEGKVHYLAGCGITAESDPQAELAESEAKAAAFRRALSGSGPETSAR